MAKLGQPISEREREVIKLLCDGFNSKIIGRNLEITELTVQTHRRNILKKLGLKNSHQVVGWAFREGLMK